MPQPHGDSDDDLAALDFFAADEPGDHDYGHESDALDFSAYDTSPSHDTGVDALHGFTSDQPEDTGSDFAALHAQGSADAENKEEGDISSQLFTVTNPPGTVTVTALMDGRILHVELDAQVANMSESDLADEILVIADLARQKGLAGQHSFLFDTMSGLGANDNSAIRDLLENGLALSSPEQAAEAQAEVFATRYNADHE